MSFLEPTFIYFMVPALLVLAYFIFTNKNQLERVFSKEILKKLTINPSTLDKKTREIFLFVALFFMIIALARPVYDKGKIEVAIPSTILLIALDVSKSMEADDFYPTRLNLAQKKIENLLDMLDGVRVGIIAFSDRGYLVSPVSEDMASVKFLFQNIHKESLRSFGTDYIVPIDISSMFTKEQKADLLIVTDGGDKKEFEKEIELAKKRNIKVSILAYATKKGAPIKDQNGFLKDAKGDIVVSSLNENIKELALKTGGIYIKGAYGQEDIEQFAKMIQSLQIKQKESKKIDNYQELFYYPLILSLILLFVSFYSLPKRVVIAFLAVVSMQDLQSGMLDFIDIQKADEAYRQKKYEESSKIYKNLPNSHESRYNYANSLYKKGDYKGAIKEFESIKSEDLKLNFRAKYNLGNSYAQTKQYDKAIKSYEDALKIQNDDDAKYNLELVKKMKKKEKEKKQDRNKNKKDQKKKQDKKQNKKDNNKQNSDQQKKEQDKKKKDEKNKQQSNDSNKNDKKSKKDNKKGDKQKEQQLKKREKMSDSEYKRWQDLLQKQRQKTLPLQIKSKTDEKKDTKNVW